MQPTNSLSIERQRKKMALLSMTIALSMIFLDAAILPTALPTIQSDLALSTISLTWVMNAYFLVSATFVIAAGRLADHIGYKKIFSTGVVIFASSAIGASLATTGAQLIVARAMQGLGVSFIGPSATAIILSTYPSKERGKALGISIGISSIFLALGPFVGGAITQIYSWRYLFYLYAPISLLGILLTRSLEEKKALHYEKFDLKGFFLLVISISSLIFASMNAKRWGWFSPAIVFLFTASIISMLSLYLLYRKNKQAFIDFSLFKNRSFSLGILLMFCAQFALMNTIFWWIYFQKALLFSPLHTGFLSLLYAVPTILVSPFVGIISDKRGYDSPIILGLVFILVGACTITLFIALGFFSLVKVSLFIYGCGTSSVLTATGGYALRNVPPYWRGMASGIYNTVRFGSAAFGIAVLSTIRSHIKHKEMRAIRDSFLDLQGYSTQELIKLIRGKVFSSEIQETVSPELFGVIKQSYINISTYSFQVLNLVVSGILIACLFVCISHFNKTS